MKTLFALFLIILLGGCASASDQLLETMAALPSSVIVCAEFTFSSGTAGTILPVQGNGALKYIRLPADDRLSSITPEMIDAIEQAICP